MKKMVGKVGFGRIGVVACLFAVSLSVLSPFVSQVSAVELSSSDGLRIDFRLGERIKNEKTSTVYNIFKDASGKPLKAACNKYKDIINELLKDNPISNNSYSSGVYLSINEFDNDQIREQQFAPDENGSRDIKNRGEYGGNYCGTWTNEEYDNAVAENTWKDNAKLNYIPVIVLSSGVNENILEYTLKSIDRAYKKGQNWVDQEYKKYSDQIVAAYSDADKAAGGSGAGSIEEASRKEAEKNAEAVRCKAEGFLSFIVCGSWDPISVAGDTFVKMTSDMLSGTSAALTKKAAKPMEDAWTNMRTFGNIILAICFMIIIYSTAVGGEGGALSNYNVKKLLPKLIIAAIIVNTSFYICMALVDFSNILAHGVSQLISSSTDGLAGVATISNKKTDDPVNPAIGWGITAGAITGMATVGGAGASGVVLMLLVFVLIPALLIILTVWLLIEAREVILAVMIIFSPIIFCASLLPNTQQLFKKATSMFIKLLLIFPAFALVNAICIYLQDVLVGTGAI